MARPCSGSPRRHHFDACRGNITTSRLDLEVCYLVRRRAPTRLARARRGQGLRSDASPRGADAVQGNGESHYLRNRRSFSPARGE